MTPSSVFILVALFGSDSDYCFHYFVCVLEAFVGGSYFFVTIV